jgi:outer membrane protein assembly factor BamB
MKNKLNTTLILFCLLAILLTSCTSSATTATSWGAASFGSSSAYYSDGSKVYALKVDNGNSKWEYPTEKANASRLILAAPVEVGDQVLIGDYNGALTSLDVRDGKENWSFSKSTGKYIDSPLVVADTILAANSDHNLYALDLEGNELWFFAATNAFWAQPVSDGTTVFAPSLDHYLYALDLATGKLAWKTDLNAPLVSRAALADGVIYIGNLEDGVFAIDSQTGKILWTQNVSGGVWAAPIVAEKKLYFGDQSGNINVINAADGSIDQTISTDSPVLGSGAQLSDGILFGNEKGDLIMVGFDGAKKWTHSINGAIYSNIVVDGETILVVANKGEKPLIAMDHQGNEIWYKE